MAPSTVAMSSQVEPDKVRFIAPGILPAEDGSSLTMSQALRASKALLAHIKSAKQESTEGSSKKPLLEDEESSTPIWLTLTTKSHIHETRRLKPHKIALPHTLNTDPEATICLITPEPQRHYKNVVASDSFPAALRNRITRVIDLKHLQAKFKQYEAQRKLYAECDIFLADDRILNRLPKHLGNVFYKTTTKRPIPVVFQKPRPKVDKKRVKRVKGTEDISARAPADIAAEIEKALGSALVNLSPTTNTAIKVGYADWKPEHLAANIEALALALVERHVPKKWDNVKAIFIKAPKTTALPIWQTDELWLQQSDVVPEGSEEAKAIEAKREKANVGKKRKVRNLDGQDSGDQQPSIKKIKGPIPDSNDDGLDKQINERKERLKKQKKAAEAALEEELTFGARGL